MEAYRMPKEKAAVEFKRLPEIGGELKDCHNLTFVWERVQIIDDLIDQAVSRKAKLRVITQSAAMHIACLQIAHNKLVQGEKQASERKAWTKAMVMVAERLKSILERQNVVEHLQHFEKPRIARILAENGRFYRRKVQRQTQDKPITPDLQLRDVEFVVQHWEITRKYLKLKPAAEVLGVEECDRCLTWLKTTMDTLADVEEMNQGRMEVEGHSM